MATPTTTLTPEQSMAALQALLNGPAGTPPAGVMPDFDSLPHLYIVGIVTVTLCLFFSTLAVFMRMYTKIFLIRSIAPEDYAVVIGWLGQIAEIVPSALTLRHGVSAHMWNVRVKDFFKLLEYFNLAGILYCSAIFFVKLSILLQYLRIFVPTRRSNMFLFVGVHICIWSCFICYLVSAAFLIAMCKPREKIWNPFIAGHCFNTGANYQATGIFNVISDFTILILPIPSLWKLQLPLKRKFGLIAIFATGFFACITSVARVYYTWEFIGSSDISYNIAGVGLWTWAEIATGIIVSCLPVLPRFFQYIAPKLHRLITLGAKPGTTFGHKSGSSGSSGVMKTTGLSFKYKRPFGKSARVDSTFGGANNTSVTWNDQYDPRAQLRAEYITLEEIETESSKGDINGREAGQLNGVPAPHTGGEV